MAMMCESNIRISILSNLGTSLYTTDTAAIAAVAKFGEEYDLNIAMAGTTAIDSRTGAKPSAPLEPLSVDWSFREWFGLGLCLSTILMATLLSVLSSHLQHRQAAKRLWGFTEEGVGELLKVGWTYHQEGNGQLFLKVFDKGKFGYSDENSILDGNIIDDAGREVSATSATTATPAS